MSDIILNNGIIVLILIYFLISIIYDGEYVDVYMPGSLVSVLCPLDG
jgi:hypothetical protein